ncbi:SDR family oxidoreductase [soil metagenome]
MAHFSLDIPDCVIVTGASSGLGRETTTALLASGVEVIGVDHGVSVFDAEAGYRHLSADVADESTWTAVVESLPAELRSLGYVGSAAVLDVETLAGDRTAELWRRTWEVNVLGNILAVRALLPVMRRLEHGAIVAVASVNAQFGEQQLGAYSSSKGALVSGIRAIALDYGRSGVHINVLAPGPMRAGLFERHLKSADDPAAFLAKREARQPIGRIPGADEVASAGIFLLSKQASALHGTTLTADGGLTAGFDFRMGGEGASVAI